MRVTRQRLCTWQKRKMRSADLRSRTHTNSLVEPRSKAAAYRPEPFDDTTRPRPPRHGKPVTLPVFKCLGEDV